MSRPVQNFIKKYGRAQFKMLIKMFLQGDNNQQIGDYFGVTRERVRHWKNNFGITQVVYTLNDDVKNIMDEG